MPTWHSAFSPLHRKLIFVPYSNGYMLRTKTVVWSLVGKLSKELFNRIASRRYLRALLQAGRAYQIPDATVQSEEQQVTASGHCRSDDPHVVALARVSGARTLCSHDRALHQDFRNPDLISMPRGRVYQNATHTHLLRHDYSCPRGDQKRRQRRS